MKPILIAHRGDTVNFPENTIAAFESAFEKGAGGVELDIHLDRDGNVIVVHDYLFDENKQYPFLEEVLKQFGQKGRLEIEIKALDPKCIIQTERLIRKYKPKDFEITSSILPLFPYIKKEFPNEKVGLIFDEKLLSDWMTREFIEELFVSYAKLTGANVFHIALDYWSDNLVKIMHENNFLTHTHLKDTKLEKYKKVLELKIDQCTFDDITLLEKI
ncbi:MAG: glycerophosphodiester phosphodiesterase [Patescibacteria group bacterium]|nr:glycerophosphodiester phosphodiesterase [Patescibacteria group bacterium]